MTRNEVRALEDTNPLEGLDDPLIPMNLAVVGAEPEPKPEPEPEPTDEETEDDGEEENEDEADRGYLVLVAAATRLANKEVNALRRMIKRGNDVDVFSDFYDGHISLLVENLAMSPASARQYCRARMAELTAAKDVDELLLRITTSDVAKLVNKIIEERK